MGNMKAGWIIKIEFTSTSAQINQPTTLHHDNFFGSESHKTWREGKHGKYLNIFLFGISITWSKYSEMSQRVSES